MGNKKYDSTKCQWNGNEYDSQTEMRFHKQYPNLVRHTETLVVWRGRSGDTITYTPDFYDKDRDIYIEIKGSVFQFNDDAFQLRWKLAIDTIGKQHLRALVPVGGEWLAPEAVKEAKKGVKMRITEELNTILNLMGRKRLSLDEKQHLIDLVLADGKAWLTSNKKYVVAKRKPIIELRAKLKRAKDKMELLEKIL